MIGAFVTFHYETGFDAAALHKIADGARGLFEGMPGLRSKLFTVHPESREARNVYVWDSEEAARAFFTEQMRERVTGLYGVRPRLELVQIAALVDNAARK